MTPCSCLQVSSTCRSYRPNQTVNKILHDIHDAVIIYWHHRRTLNSLLNIVRIRLYMKFDVTSMTPSSFIDISQKNIENLFENNPFVEKILKPERTGTEMPWNPKLKLNQLMSVILIPTIAQFLGSPTNPYNYSTLFYSLLFTDTVFPDIVYT